MWKLLCALLLLSGSFSSVALGNPLVLGYPSTLTDNAKPALIITPQQDVATLQVTIEVGGAMHKYTLEDLPAGVAQRIEWPRDTAITSATAYLLAEFTDRSEREMQVEISYAYGGQLSVDLSHATADTSNNTVTVEVSALVEHAEIVAWGAHKVQLDTATVTINDGPGEITIPWVGRASDVVLLDITLHNPSGWAGFTFSPWFLDIPHDDVLFESNSDLIKDSESHKLEATLIQLRDVLNKYGDIVPVKLYIAGCTDTVGSVSSNRDLSKRRARAIAKWLRNQGFPRPIYYYGFGEALLAVPTADSTDYAANRRVLYMVGANPPPGGSGIPAVTWTPL